MDRKSYFTHKPLVIFGATGMLGSEFTFYAALHKFSDKFILHGSDISRLKGVKDELEESGFEGLHVRITTSVDDALSEGGYVFFSRSTKAKLQSRESMLLGNAPLAKELGVAIKKCSAEIERVVCVSNPSDLMGLLILLYSELDPKKVMSLSALDTTRFRRSLSRHLSIPMEELSSAITLGSHDMKMAPMIGLVKHRGKKITDQIDKLTQEKILKEVMYAGTVIYKLRGHTAYQSPSVLSLRIMMATDQNPFTLPTARYHNSKRYPYTFGSFPTMVDSEGCKHIKLRCGEEDAKRLDLAFSSISGMRDKLILERLLPPIELWPEPFHKQEGLLHIEK